MQAAAFWSALDTIAAGDASGAPAVAPDVPMPDQVAGRDAGTVEAGDRFAAEMAQWCATTKFQVASPWAMGYADVYGRALGHLRHRPIRLLEIGIGINDPNAPSGMQATHQVGASLLGWSNYFPQGEIHGADVDRRALVSTDRYRTHFVDQRDRASLNALALTLGSPLDVVVDDGLHTPEANANTIATFLPMLSADGVLVVEDILEEFGNLWHALSRRLRTEYRVTYFPASCLRQMRGPGTHAGIAVFTRAVSASP